MTRRAPRLSMTRLLAISRKEAIQLRRDRRSMIFAFILPLLLLVIFGYAISWDVKNIAMVVLDRDRTPDSRAFTEALLSSGYFTPAASSAGLPLFSAGRDARRLAGGTPALQPYVSREAEYEAMIDRGDAVIAFVIPRGFASDLRTGESAVVQAVLDGSDANSSTIATAYAQAVVLSYSSRIILERSTAKTALPISAQSRVWYNEELRSRNMIVPGLVAVIMAVIAAMLTSLTIAREWERGTMEQLASTPASRFEIVIGKLLPYVVIGLIDIAMITLAGVYLFHVPFRGSVLLLFALSTLFLLGALGVGIFISAAAKSQLVATQAAMVTTYLPSFLLSGFMFAIEAMPPPLRAISWLVPARYFLVVTRGIFLKGVGIEVLHTQGLLMLLFAAVGLGLAMVRFRKVIE